MGVGGAWLVLGFLESLLAGVPPRDPQVMAVVGVGLLLISLAASAGPALAASRVEPVEALREE